MSLFGGIYYMYYPKGFMRIRYYGFLANACRQKKVAVIQEQQGLIPKKVDEETKATSHHAWPCAKCKTGRLTLAVIILPKLIKTR